MVAKDKTVALNRIYSQLSGFDPKTVHKLMLDLEASLLNNRPDVAEELRLLKHMESKNMFPNFQKAYEIFETNLEVEFAERLVYASSSPLKDFKTYPLYRRFVTLLTNEINLANIKDNDHVLFIGSGPVPITAILIHQLTKARVDCGEKNNVSANLSKKLIVKLGYTESIRVINQNGIEMDYSPYSVILVALLAKPKDLLLKSIWGESKAHTRIICRTSDSIRQAFYETTEETLFDNYRIKKKVFAKDDQTISSVLIIKP